MRLLEVKDLKTSFFTKEGEVEAVRGISFSIDEGEIVGIVGESGSGKSVTAMSLINLIKSPGKIKNGQVIFKGEDILKKTDTQLRDIRGNKISMIFQDPLTSLNPVYTIGEQIADVLIKHMHLNKKDARKKVIELLRSVGIANPEKRINSYPHEFSGGQRQRIMIAMAISCNIDILIADEPTTALDVTIQQEILSLLKGLNKSIIIITHDLGVVSKICSKVIVMYGGFIVEEGSVEEIFYNAKHPYTKGLLRCVTGLEENNRLDPISGEMPSLLNPKNICPFYERCSRRLKVCSKKIPDFKHVSDTQKCMCHLNQKEGI